MSELPAARLSGVMLDRASHSFILHFDVGVGRPRIVLRLDTLESHRVMHELGNFAEYAEDDAGEPPAGGSSHSDDTGAG
jgi:hypothetical protein